jgi:hypothetical protein
VIFMKVKTKLHGGVKAGTDRCGNPILQQP